MLFAIRVRPQVFRMALLAGSSFVLLGAAQPKAATPQVVNNAQSLMVESFDRDDDGYNLSLRSNSPVAVFGVAIAVIGEKGVCDLHTFGPLTGSFIAPSGNRALPPLPFPDSEAGGWGPRIGACSETAVPERQPENSESLVNSKIVVEAVDFEDGSYEGDRAISAMLEARRVARSLQRQRIAALVAEELESAGPDGPDWVETMRTRVSALTDQPDAKTVQSLQARFGPTITTDESIRKEFQSWLMFEKVVFLNNLKIYVTVSSHRGLPIVSLQAWWDATKGECDFFWPQCRNETL
jgi:hypothetical protein